jgi:hypothetical protein
MFSHSSYYGDANVFLQGHCQTGVRAIACAIQHVYTHGFLKNQTRETDPAVLEDEITKMTLKDAQAAYKSMRYRPRSMSVGCFNRPPTLKHFIPLQKVWDGRWGRGMARERNATLNRLRTLLNQPDGMSLLQDVYFQKCEFIATEAMIRRLLQKNTVALWATLQGLSLGPQAPAGWSAEFFWYNLFVEQLP